MQLPEIQHEVIRQFLECSCYLLALINCKRIQFAGKPFQIEIETEKNLPHMNNNPRSIRFSKERVEILGPRLFFLSLHSFHGLSLHHMVLLIRGTMHTTKKGVITVVMSNWITVHATERYMANILVAFHKYHLFYAKCFTQFNSSEQNKGIET